MKRLLSLFRAFRAFVAHYPPLPEQMPEWTDADAEALSRFFAGSTGRKLQLMAQQTVAIQNQAAVFNQTKSQKYGNGWASGWRAALVWLTNLSVTRSPEEADSDTSTGGRVDLDEQLSP